MIRFHQKVENEKNQSLYDHHLNLSLTLSVNNTYSNYLVNEVTLGVVGSEPAILGYFNGNSRIRFTLMLSNHNK
jgi:hypothetical protein